MSIKAILEKVADEGAICERLGATHVVDGFVIGDRGPAFSLLVEKVRALVRATYDDGVTDYDWAAMIVELDFIVHGDE
jgi:hypothetical protein